LLCIEHNINFMNVENANTQMRKGIIEFCVLLIISRGEVYSSDLIGELNTAKLIVVEGTLYPLLTRLKNAGQLSYTWRESATGPPRKYYSLTDSGRETLGSLIMSWKETEASVGRLLAYFEAKQEHLAESEKGSENLTVPENGTDLDLVAQEGNIEVASLPTPPIEGEGEEQFIRL
jgi:PadR family transcriptional regulator, regulatory protein PadR